MSASELPQGRILVASSGKEDARLIASLLQDDFRHVRTSFDPRDAVKDFEDYRPQLLVLGFRTVADAERYYLSLYRLSSETPAVPHRTLLLCDRAEAARVFELCQQHQFDDYAIFWPSSYDPYRLRMGALSALRAMARDVLATTQELAMHGSAMADLSVGVEQQLARGSDHAERLASMIKRAEHEATASIEELSGRFEGGSYSELVEVRDKDALRTELKRFGTEKVEPPFASLRDALQPIRQWVAGLERELRPSLQSAKAIAEIAQRLAPLLLIVDDDVFQHRMIEHQLRGTGFQFAFATNGAGAMAAIRNRQPDLVLLDFYLPDMSGVEFLKKLRTADSARGVPVIMMSGTTTRDVVVESRLAGAVEVMAKPLERSRLIPSIERHLTDARPTAEGLRPTWPRPDA